MKLAVLGDIHLRFDAFDVRYFNASGYDALLITGDLPGMRHERAYEVAERLAGLTLPAFMIAGNHDATTLPQLLADIAGVKGGPLMRPGPHQERVARLKAALGPVTLGGYSGHMLSEDLGLIIGRPHAQGGGLSFLPYLKETYGVSTMAESAERLIAVVETLPCERLVFLAHNGPSGLGGAPTDIWGCDFKREGGDWGDPDLELAITHAKEQGKRVLSVVAGHMHQRTKTREDRTWLVEKAGTHYVNAAYVPRIIEREGERTHHHVALTLEEGSVRVEAQWVRAD